MKKLAVPLFSFACLLTPLAVCAASPVAVVENVKGDVAVEFMDYVAAGQVIELGRNGVLVLSYMNSCVRETITGGTVIALEKESLVQGGKVERSRPPCDAKRMELNSRQADQSAGTVYRSGPKEARETRVKPLVLYGRSPMVQIDGQRTSLVINSIDKPGQRIEVGITDDVIVRGKFLDFAKAGIVLRAGGHYVASIGESQVEFTIDPDAKPGATPVVGRLLRFQ